MNNNSNLSQENEYSSGSMMIVVDRGKVTDFESGPFATIGSLTEGSGLLIDHEAIFRTKPANLAIATGSLAQGDYQSYIDSMEDGFACIGFEKGRPQWLMTDPFGQRRLYYFSDSTRLIIAEDPLQLLAKAIDWGITPEIDQKQFERYRLLGYADEGRTFLRAVGRSVAGMQIRFDDQSPEDLLRRMAPMDSRFDEVMESTIYRASRNTDGIALLFSGGMDSTALLLASLEGAPDRDIVCITAVPEPKTLVDVRIKAQLETSKKIAKHLGVRHEIMTMNFANPQQQADIARAQPFDFGISNWMPVFTSYPETRNHLFICGQNADSLSNFGHTAPFLNNGRDHKKMMLGKRLLVTRQFLESRYKQILSPILEKLFVRSGRYRIARNDQEVFDFFFQPEMYRVPMAMKGARHGAGPPLPEDYTSVTDELFLRNLRRYNDSSLARLFRTVASLTGSKALLPFAARDVIRFYRHRLHVSSTIEQLQGKYQICDYVTRRVPKSMLNAGYMIEEKSNRTKIRTKNRIKRDACRVWASVLPPPLDTNLIGQLDAENSDRD